MKPHTLRKKLEKLGFVFTQPEYCTQGNFFVYIDTRPYLANCSNVRHILFNTFNRFLEFYNTNKSY